MLSHDTQDEQFGDLALPSSGLPGALINGAPDPFRDLEAEIVRFREILRTSDEFKALCRAAYEDPQDDTVRLVVADWLQDQDCYGRAALIRSEVGHSPIQISPELRARLEEAFSFELPNDVTIDNWSTSSTDRVLVAQFYRGLPEYIAFVRCYDEERWTTRDESVEESGIPLSYKLLDYFQDDPSDAAHCRDFLRALAPYASAKILIPVMFESLNQANSALAPDQDWETRCVVKDILSKFAKVVSPMALVPLLSDVLERSDFRDDLKLLAIDTLVELGSCALMAESALRSNVEAANHDLRVRSAYALKKIGASDAESA